MMQKMKKHLLMVLAFLVQQPGFPSSFLLLRTRVSVFSTSLSSSESFSEEWDSSVSWLLLPCRGGFEVVVNQRIYESNNISSSQHLHLCSIFRAMRLNTLETASVLATFNLTCNVFGFPCVLYRCLCVHKVVIVFPNLRCIYLMERCHVGVQRTSCLKYNVIPTFNSSAGVSSADTSQMQEVHFFSSGKLHNEPECIISCKCVCFRDFQAIQRVTKGGHHDNSKFLTEQLPCLCTHSHSGLLHQL